jgi:hypothetical protein
VAVRVYYVSRIMFGRSSFWRQFVKKGSKGSTVSSVDGHPCMSQ